jgi:hypothetical protein
MSALRRIHRRDTIMSHIMAPPSITELPGFDDLAPPTRIRTSCSRSFRDRSISTVCGILPGTSNLWNTAQASSTLGRPMVTTDQKTMTETRPAKAPATNGARQESELSITLEVEPRKPRIRWALCSPGGKFAFHWKRMMAPQTIIDYVVVHELCHFDQRDHMDPFWNDVDKVMPDFRERKEWLRKNGAGLDV